MSMLSAQIDKLRALADRMDGIVPNTPDELRDAADTIWQLRNDLQRANAENARLRELANAVKEFVEDTHCEDCPCRRDCDDNNSIFCANDFSYHAFAAMRELGVG